MDIHIIYKVVTNDTSTVVYLYYQNYTQITKSPLSNELGLFTLQILLDSLQFSPAQVGAILLNQVWQEQSKERKCEE